MDYNGYFSDAVARLQSERRYRVFADLERIADRFPHAVWHSPPYYAYGCYGYCAESPHRSPGPAYGAPMIHNRAPLARLLLLEGESYEEISL